MRLDLELVRRKLCESRQEAQECIEQGFVLLDGKKILKSTRQVTPNSDINVVQTRKFVSRGGDKLEGAILKIYPHAAKNLFRDKSALDIGSSTGGFTDCLLLYEASHVTAVDVGTSQLHTSLRNDLRITLFENIDIRDFKGEGAFDVIVADVSFISLEKILHTIINFGHQDSEFFLLIKPQFEVGFGNTKKGVVKDLNLVDKVLLKYDSLLHEHGCRDIQIFPSTLKGGDGNQEYFVYCRK